MQNLQQIPGDTDVENPIPDDRAPSEEKRNYRRDLPLPTDRVPSEPVNEPNKPASINENPKEPVRIMSYFTAAQRRIF